MLLAGSLGFQCLLAVLGWFAFFVIRYKWRNAVAKKEEIMRLVAMASEEAAMAEVEATVQYASAPVVGRYQCAVCRFPTTMRCSKCKAVRYCSGRCQIVHWRQGHKEKCYLSPDNLLSEDDDVISRGQSEIDYDDTVMGRKSKLSSEASSMKNNDEENEDEKVRYTCSDFKDIASVGTSLPSAVSQRSVRSESIAASSKNGQGLETLGSSGKLPSTKVSPDGAIKFSSEKVEGTRLQYSKSTNASNHPDSVSSANKLGKKKSSHSGEGFDSQLRSSRGNRAIYDVVQPSNVGHKKPTREAHLAAEIDADVSTSRSPPYGKGEGHAQLSNGINVEPLTCHVSGGHQSSTIGGHPVPFSKMALPVRSGANPSLSQNVSNGLKTSMRKVVQHLKVSKQSKSSQQGSGNEVPEKCNYKLLFPYDLFVELYYCDKVELFPFGLTNCGNSCYANAVLQCLAFTRPLTSYLLQGIHSRACQKMEWCFICEFERLILKAREGTSPLSPVSILSKIHKIGSHLGNGRQEDAHEFLRYAVDAMQSVCLKEAGALGSSAEETTLVGLTFGGHLLSKIKCLKCLSKSERCERMMDLTVEIDGDIGTLEDALAQFTAAEILDRDNKYRCSRCKSYEKARKKLAVLEAPNILTIVLKRFQSGNFEKLNKLVKFPEILNISPFMSKTSDDSPSYSLYAVVVHKDSMNAAYSGHYLCYVKNFQGQWFMIDDSVVEPVTLKRVLSEGAYMLLYSRRTPRPPTVASNGGKLRKKSLEAVPSTVTRSKSRSNFVVPKAEASTAHRKAGKYYSYSMTYEVDAGNRSFDLDDWEFRSAQRSRAIDSSSESSSIFSSSDASSCSTASTKDSVATEDFSDYIFGEAGSNWYNGYGISPESVASSSYQNYDVNLSVEGERNSRVLYTDTSRHSSRRLTSHLDSDSRRSGWGPADFDHLVYANPSFRTSGDRSAQTFY